MSIVFKPKGRMNKDLDKRYLSGGDFTDSLNTRSITTLGGSTGDREIVDGNTFVWQLDSVVLQNRVFRIYIDAASVGTTNVDFLDGNSVFITTASVLHTGVIAADLATFAFNIDAALTLAFESFVPTTTTITGGSVGFVTVEIITIPGWDYQITDAAYNQDQQDVVLAQEAVTADMLGEWHNIGGYDLEGEAYTWWTTRTGLPVTLDISAIAFAGTLFQITTTLPHNQTAGSLVTITGTTVADGNWIIGFIDANNFTLLGSTFVVGSTIGTVTTNASGLGEVGHAVRNENTLVWTYVRLIRSKVFNFTTKHQIDTYCEKSALYKGLYWTDDYNVPRVLYDRTINYVNDVLLSFIDPLNTYSYLTLFDESTLVLSNNDLNFTFISQTQSGGNVASGNSRYTVRLVTETNTYTDWYFLDNPIPATKSVEAGSGHLFFGQPPNIPTGKINNFLVTGDLLGIFKYIELGVVNYQGLAKTGWIVGRFLINSNSMTIQHTGYETATQDLDIGTIGVITKIYNRAKSIDSLDGQLILSNLTSASQLNLSDWAQTWMHTLGYEEMTGVGNYNTGGVGAANLSIGEYQLSDNVYRIAGHQLFETHRYAVVAEMYDGSTTDSYWIDDIIFTTSATNDTNPLPAVSRRIAGLADYNLTDNSIPPIPRSFYVEFSGFDLDAIVDGVRLRDVIKRLFIMRAPRTTPTVLASGIGIAAVNGTVASGAVGGSQNLGWWDGVSNNALGEFPLVGGFRELGTASGLPINYAYNQAGAFSDFGIQPTWAAIYFADDTYNHSQILPQIGFDQIINFGMPSYDVANNLLVPNGQYPDTRFNDYILETTGFPNFAPVILTVTAGANIIKGGSANVGGTVFYKQLLFAYDLGFFPDVLYEAPESLVVQMSAGLDRLTAFGSDRGLRQIIYKRPLTLTQQYGDINNTQYEWTGTVIDIDQNTISPFPTGTHVFGGDVFTQRTYLQNRYMTVDPPKGFGQGLAYYAQNVINFQMRNGTPTGVTPDTAFPSVAVQTWLGTVVPLETISYNEGYTIRNEVESSPAFDVNNQNNIADDFPCRIIYSAKKVPESAQDSYRSFMALNFKDLDYKYGEIVSHLVINGELLTWQIDRFQRQFFNDTNMMTASGVEVILGDGAALARRGIDLSTYGCSNKWSIFKGKSKGGKDTVYWIDVKRKLSIRFGYDGTVNISIIHGMDSWFQNRLRYIKDTPADGEGICGVWNERHKEAIWTVWGWKEGVNIWVEPFEVLHDFTTFGAFRPYSNVVDINGILYGISFIGGASTYGLIYSYDIATGTYTNLFNLLLASGGNVIADIIAIGTVIYGVTSNGGASSSGVIFSFDTATNTYTNLKSFNGTTDGDTPSSGLLNISGVLYGVTFFGGSGTGTLFSYNIATTVFTVLQNLTVNSRSNLVTIGTILYGTSGANIFSFTGSIYTLIPLPAVAFAGLTLSGTTLYGTTDVGGTGNLGTIFSYDTVTATLTTLYNFSGVDGATPRASMILNGNYLVGTTNGGGVNSLGTIFVYNIITNTYQKIFDFTAASGSLPQSTLLFYNNVFYGTAADGGVQIGSDGTLFSFKFFGIGSVTQTGLTGFEQLPAFYQSLIDYNLSDPLTSDTWELVPFSNYEYYNVYTIVFNEITNGFDGFYSFKPKIYLAWRNTFLSPRPVSNTGTMYEFNRGAYAVFYNDGTTSQAEDGKFKFVINALPDEIKKAYAVRFRSEITPARVDITSSGGQQTFMVAADFQLRKLNYDCSVRNNILISSDGLSNNEDTGRNWGDYFELELTFSHSVYQRIYMMALRVPYIDPRRLQT